MRFHMGFQLPNDFAYFLCRHMRAEVIRATSEDRGWINVPRAYAEEAFPKEMKSGWWPHKGPQPE